jgi:predicted nucleotide-binding protein (sugar kinase/HSP70/actin superfamily)
VTIAQSAVTGYGEDLIKAGLGLDHGLVETIAHTIAAQSLAPDVSFVLDIGGQDIKAIFLHSGAVRHIEINEACSSGCGTFIEGFARTLGFSATEFARRALDSTAPCDLGTRCTVFMNSKVKQSLREGSAVEDIAAGLAYAVVKNCLYKVLKVTGLDELGEHIVVQGGTFRNLAVVRALEKLTGKSVVLADKPELMGAYGAALFAARQYQQAPAPSTFVGFARLGETQGYQTTQVRCKGCSNVCQVTRFAFPNGNLCYAGNKCEKAFSSKGARKEKGRNIYDIKLHLLFDRPTPRTTGLRIGIPRILNMYENYPFWHALFSGCGLAPVLSSVSDMGVYKKGAGQVMSDNICFPAKLAHGHVVNLAEQKVDRIFFPLVVYERMEFKHAADSFNCPVVTGYAEVLKSSFDTDQLHGIPFDAPPISFKDERLLARGCWRYLRSLGVVRDVFAAAFPQALAAQITYNQAMRRENGQILAAARTRNGLTVLLAGHPYHADPLVQQKISQLVADLGANIINEEIVLGDHDAPFTDFFSLPQWVYHNRILQAAAWAARQGPEVAFVQLNSFGCGPDSFIINEIEELLKGHNKTYTLIRVDEITSTGSSFLRLRSLVESLKLRAVVPTQPGGVAKRSAAFTTADRGRTILVPWFADFYSPLVPPLASLGGYTVENLPPPDAGSMEFGLKYIHNDICYPAIIVVGDIMRALHSGRYNLDQVAVGLTQTGGQCRATNYLTILRQAMTEAGFDQVPIISITTGDYHQHAQPGFKLPWLRLAGPSFQGILFADGLARLYYATACRVTTPGAADTLKIKYLDQAAALVRGHRITELTPLLIDAVDEFNALPMRPGNVPAIGVVGEIYVKYNSYGHYHIVRWLEEQGVEVVMPTLINFMMQAFVNRRVFDAAHLQHAAGWLSNLTLRFVERLAQRRIDAIEKVMERFRFYRPVHPIRQAAEYAAEIVDLVNQYGEGWLIPAEIAGFAHQDVNHVIGLQPFGCISNHIIAKGVEKKIKSLYPQMNLLFLDFDPSTSEVNVQNRLHFMVKSAAQMVKVKA